MRVVVAGLHIDQAAAAVLHMPGVARAAVGDFPGVFLAFAEGPVVGAPEEFVTLVGSGYRRAQVVVVVVGGEDQCGCLGGTQ
ncbi:hypothetical protein D9M68_807180 [compost metagenome]